MTCDWYDPFVCGPHACKGSYQVADPQCRTGVERHKQHDVTQITASLLAHQDDKKQQLLTEEHGVKYFYAS